MTLLLDKNSQNPSLVSLQNKHFRTALDQLSNGVLLLDLHSPFQIEPKIVYVNDGLLELSGFESEDLIGEALSKVFGFRKLKILLDRLDAIISGGDVYEFKNELQCADSNALDCNWRVSCLYDDDNQATNFLLTVSDSSEHLSQIDSEIKVTQFEENNELESVPLSVRNEILAMQARGIAHDFKNMLTTVVANLSLIRDSIQDSEIIARINDAMQASKEATGLASQLLAYSRGNNESKKEEVDVSALLKDAARICTAGSKTRCDVTIEEGLWLSLTNRTQIIQVLSLIHI